MIPRVEPSLEVHHLLALSEDGPDTPENVVALCANHHREAHYGRDRVKLEAAVVAMRQERAGRSNIN
jgi:5-methylcytosine-specific restriction protein A